MSKTITVLYKSNVFKIWISEVKLKECFLPDSFLGNVCIVNLNNTDKIYCLSDERYREGYIKKFLKNPKRFARNERSFLNFMITGNSDQHPFQYLRPIHVIGN
jgi:hypothetical protein